MAEGAPYFMRTPALLYCLPPTLFLQILSTPPSPTSLSPPTPTPLFFLLSCFLGWMVDHTTFDMLLNDNMIIKIYMLSLGIIVQEGPWCVFYARGLTHNVVFYWYSDLISHTHKHANLYIYTTCYVLTAATFITLND